MKAYIYSLFLGFLCGITAISQPAMTSTNIPIDIDGNGARDLLYTIGASGPFGDFPVTWVVGSSINVSAITRFLRASSNHVFFEPGEPVDSTLDIYQENSSVGILFGFGMIGYQAESYGGNFWEYTTLGSNPLFESRSEVLLGARLVAEEAVHYGWLRLSRPVVDNHTLFEVSGYDWNPVPGAPIGAGEPPGPPPLHASLSGEGQLLFNWESAYGEMLLEWAANLTEPVDWQPVPDSAWPPLQLPLAEAGQRFFRLRRP